MDGALGKGRVLIVDDQPLIVEYLRIWTEACSFEVCGTARTTGEALAQALEHRPDVVLMDVQLDRGGDGVEAAAAIRDVMPARIVFVTGSNDRASLARIEASQPVAVLIKPVDPEELAQALERAMAAG